MTIVTTWTVKELATLAGVSVRTLHYYHHTGLLPPARVGDNGYRSYGRAEFVRLQQILFFRELEFPLDRIRQLLDDPDLDATAAYRDHRRLLVARRRQLDRLIATLDQELRPKGGTAVTDQDTTRMSERYTNDELDTLREEARERWGETDAWRQSRERTKGYTPADYKQIEDENRAALRALVADMSKGISSSEVQAHIAGHRERLRHFYDPSDELYRGLASLYVDDERFADYYREFHPDLPAFLRDAMRYSLGDR